MIVQLFITQIVIFIGVIFVLRAFFYRHLNEALKKLKELQKEGIKKEAQLNDELERVRKMRASEVERSKSEAKELIEGAKGEAKVLRIKLEEDAKRKAREIVEQGKEELERMKSNFAFQIEDKAAGLSLEMIKHIFTQSGKEGLQRQLVEELILEVEKIDQSKFTVESGIIEVTSASSLTGDQKSRLKKILSEKMGSEITLNEKIDKDLIVGFIIKIGVLSIDGSLKNKFNKIISYLKENGNKK